MAAGHGLFDIPPLPVLIQTSTPQRQCKVRHTSSSSTADAEDADTNKAAEAAEDAEVEEGAADATEITEVVEDEEAEDNIITEEAADNRSSLRLHHSKQLLTPALRQDWRSLSNHLRTPRSDHDTVSATSAEQKTTGARSALIATETKPGHRCKEPDSKEPIQIGINGSA
ncbi:hypothetical protein RI054_10g54010 [Pseudoscourfieldia marina]